MSWNYRLCKSSENGYTEYAIHECYYSPTGISITENPVTVSVAEPDNDISDEDAKKEIRWVLGKMLEALDKSVIDADNLSEES